MRTQQLSSSSDITRHTHHGSPQVSTSETQHIRDNHTTPGDSKLSGDHDAVEDAIISTSTKTDDDDDDSTHADSTKPQFFSSRVKIIIIVSYLINQLIIINSYSIIIVIESC